MPPKRSRQEISTSKFFLNSPSSGFASSATFDFKAVISSEKPFEVCDEYRRLAENSVKIGAQTLRPPLKLTTRHLCANCCFYKAYAPLRAWHNLRKRLSNAELSPDVVLEGWTTELCKSDKGAWHVAFVAPNGEEFSTVEAVCCELGVGESSGSSKRRGHNGAPRSRVLVEAELLQTTSWKDIDPRSRKNKRIKAMLAAEEVGGLREEEPAQNLGVTLWPGKSFIFSPSRESPFGLLEELTCDDPWKLLLTCMLLNKTTRRQVDPVLFDFLNRWPNYEALLQPSVKLKAVELCVEPCGLHQKRARNIVSFSRQFRELVKAGVDTRALKEEQVFSMSMLGEYSWDAYRLFILGEVISCRDGALNMYSEWRRGMREGGEGKL